MNCNLSELRLVSPRDGWPLTSPQKERAMAASSGADSILENAKLFETTAEAVADLNAVYATTARSRDMTKRVMTPRAAVEEIIPRIGPEKIGLLFGPERTGLLNEDLLCANTLINIPANPEFSSFNLAQTVLILAYEWLMQNSQAPANSMPIHNKSRPATREELFHFFDHLERELDITNFFSTEAMRPAMVQNLRNALSRAEFSEQEVRTLHGVITALVLDPSRKKKHG